MEIKTILRAIFITILPTVEVGLSLIDRINNFKTTEQMNLHTVFSIVSIVGTFFVVLYLLHKYEMVKNKMELFNLISAYRNKSRFIEQFNQITYYRHPDETDEELFKRLPQGQYLEELKKEYQVIKIAATNMLDLKPSETQKLLDDAYGIKPQKKHK